MYARRYVLVMPRYKIFYIYISQYSDMIAYHDYHDMLNLVNSLMYDLLFAPIAYIQVIESIRT